MDRVKEYFAYFLTAMAVITSILTAYSALEGKLAAAGVLGCVFVACTLFTYLPQMESFKAFGVEATLQIQQKLDRAEEILKKVRELSIVSAKASYFNIASAGRWGSKSDLRHKQRDKQNALDLIDDQLNSIGISEEERLEIARPHINYIGYELYVKFYQTAKSALQSHCQDASTIVDWDKKYMPLGVAKIESIFKDGSQFTTYLKEQVGSSLVSTDDNQKLTAIADCIGEAFDGCIKRRGYTDDYYSLLGK
jgi:hypothetical protein